MRRAVFVLVLACAFISSTIFGSQAPAGGPYKVLKTAKVGGEGGWDYIFADVSARRLYIPRGAVRAAAATATTPEIAEAPARITVFDLDTLAAVGEIPDTGGNGVTVDPKSGHGFSTSHPDISMFDTKTLKLIKKIEIAPASGDGLYFDPFNDHVYIWSHPTKDGIVIDSHDGTVLGKIDLGGVPEQSIGDGKGTMYVVLQQESQIAVIDAKSMKVTAHYDFKDKAGRCNGLALDLKNSVLFAACANSSLNPPQGQPAQPTMVVMNAKTGAIITTLPLAGSSDGAAFNPSTMEAFSTQGNGTLTIVKENNPMAFEVEQNLQTMNGARTITFDSKTQHILTMSQERTPAPPGGGRGSVVPGSFTILVVGK